MPALYLAREFSARGDDVMFIGSGRPLEVKLIDKAGYQRRVINFIGLNKRSLRAVAQVVLNLPRAFAQSRAILKQFNPDVVVGMGGYVSVPPVLMAYLLGVPTWIHEAELYPGRSTRLLKSFAARVSLAFPSNPLAARANAVVTGHPVRTEIVSVPPWRSRSESIRHILVVGGSQGAAALDRCLPPIIASISTSQIDIWHQCREENVEKVRKLYEQYKIKARVESFIEEMCEAYAFADLIISRSGAGAVMELGAVNRATILVPFPHAQGGHQLLNARILSDAGKAVLVEEGSDFSARLELAVRSLLDPTVIAQMIEKPPPIRPLEAARLIADGCHGLVAHR